MCYEAKSKISSTFVQLTTNLL